MVFFVSSFFVMFCNRVRSFPFVNMKKRGAHPFYGSLILKFVGVRWIHYLRT